MDIKRLEIFNIVSWDYDGECNACHCQTNELIFMQLPYCSFHFYMCKKCFVGDDNESKD